MHLPTLAANFLFPALLVGAAASDVASYTIPNRISLGLGAGFFLLAPFCGLTWLMIGAHAGVAAVALVVGMALFAFRLAGGGDAKLVAASILWLGPAATPIFLFYMAMIGGGMALLLLTARQWVAPFVPGAPPWAMRLLQHKGGVPYGVAIALGALCAYPGSPLAASLQL